MRRPGKCLAAGFACALALASAHGARAADLVKEVRGEAQELLDDDKHPSYRVLFAAADGVDLNDLRARVRGARARSIGGDYAAAFTLALDRSAETGPALVVRVDFGVAAIPTTYEVDVELFRHEQPSSTQRVALQLTRPAAQLRAPSSLLLDVTAAWPGPDHLSPASFTIDEVSRRAGIGALSVGQHEHAMHGTEEVTGTLTFKEPQQVAAGGTSTWTAGLAGEFPIGVTKGRIEANAPELAGPVVINYEVRRRRPSLLIPIIMLAGGLIGWFLRVFLKRREERLTLLVQADEVGAKLAAILAKGTERALELKIQQVQETLAEARKSREDTALVEALRQADTLVAEAATKHEQQQQALLGEISQAQQVLALRWSLPAKVDHHRLDTLVGDADRLLLAGELAQAEAKTAEIRRAIGDLAAAGRDWARTLKAGLNPPEEPEAPWPPAMIEALSAGGDPVRAALDVVLAVDTVKPQLEPLLRALHAAEGAAVDLLSRLIEALHTTASRAAAMLDGLEGAEAQAASIRAAGDVEISGDAAAMLIRVNAGVKTLAGEVHACMTGPLQMDEKVREMRVEPLMKQGDYLEALKAAWPGHQEDHGSSGAESMSLALAERVEQMALPRAAAAPGPVRALSVLFRGEGLRRLSPKTPSSVVGLARTQAARAIITAIVYAAAAWALYADDFFGTTKELSALAALALSSDFTAEAALALAGKLKKD